nr:MAG TPA: hypothetical protein [Caudoviricetes sp.]
MLFVFAYPHIALIIPQNQRFRNCSLFYALCIFSMHFCHGGKVVALPPLNQIQ